MPNFWDNLQAGLSRAYSPITSGLERGTQAIFGPQAHFFPYRDDEDIELPVTPEAAEARNPFPTADPSAPPDFSPHVTDILDLNKLRGDFSLAAGGDQAARDRITAMRGAPAVTSLGRSKPSPLAERGRPLLGAPGTEDATPSLGQLPQVNHPGMNQLTSMRPQTGGGGVEVQDEHKRPRDWKAGIAGLTVGLSDIFSALGNPRAQMGKGAGYEMAKEYLQTQQMEALQRRHQMFDDAYQAAKALPPEVWTDERFSALRGAAQNILNAGDKGEVDNEKAVSAFLTENARHKSDLSSLVQQSQLTQAMAAEDAMAQHKAGLTDLYGLTPGALQQRQFAREREQDIERRREFDERQNLDYAQLAEQGRMRRDVANIQAGGRRDTQEDASRARTGRFLSSLYESGIRRRLPQGIDELDPKSQEAALSRAAEASLADITPRLIAAAQQHGIIFKDTSDEGWGSIGNPRGQYQVGEQYFSTLPEAMQYLQTLLF